MSNEKEENLLEILDDLNVKIRNCIKLIEDLERENNDNLDIKNFDDAQRFRNLKSYDNNL